MTHISCDVVVVSSLLFSRSISLSTSAETEGDVGGGLSLSAGE